MQETYEDLREEIAKARARKEAAERREDDEAERLKRELAKALTEAADAEAIASAEAELGERGLHFATHSTPLGVVILKKPNPIKFKQFQDASKLTSETCFKLVESCVHYPSLEVFDRIIKEYPGVLMLCANAVVDLAQGTRKDIEGK